MRFLRMLTNPFLVLMLPIMMTALYSIVPGLLLYYDKADWGAVVAGCIWTCGCFGMLMSAIYHLAMALRLHTVTEMQDFGKVDSSLVNDRDDGEDKKDVLMAWLKG